LAQNLGNIRAFRKQFTEFERTMPALAQTLPDLLVKLYSDCQLFAETEINALLEKFEKESGIQIA